MPFIQYAMNEREVRIELMENLMTPFILGSLAGLMVSAPVGPICLLCIRRSLAQGRVAGMATGLGSAVALAAYGSLGFAGMALLSGASPALQFWPKLLGAVILGVLGMMILRSDPRTMHSEDTSKSVLENAFSTFFLEFINPASIMIFAGIAATMVRFPGSISEYLAVGIGIFSASMLWWLILVNIVASLRRLFTPILLLWLNRGAGIFIIFLGLRPLIALL